MFLKSEGFGIYQKQDSTKEYFAHLNGLKTESEKKGSNF